MMSQDAYQNTGKSGTWDRNSDGEIITSSSSLINGAYNEITTWSLYAISLQPLITLLGIRSSAKQCWYADDATGAGALRDIRKWWDELLVAGPALGYYPNARKCWLLVKPEKLKEANDVLRGQE